MDDWVPLREALLACWTRVGIPAAVAEELLRRSPGLIPDDGAETRWIYVADHQLTAHRIEGQYYFRGDDFTRLMNLIQPNQELVDLAASGGDWAFEE